MTIDRTKTTRADGMELYADRDDLVRALQRASTVVDRKTSIPLCACVLLGATDDGLQLTATDTEVAYEGAMAANVERAGVRIAVDAKGLLGAVKSLPEPTILLTQPRKDRIEIRSGAVVYELPLMPVDDFPPLPNQPETEGIEIGRAELRRLVASTAHAVAQDDVRYGLNGAHLEVVGERLRMVATDGHRLALAETPIATPITIPPRMLVPRRALAAMRKLLDGEEPAVVSFDDGAMRIGLGTERLWFRMLDGEFPDYSAVLPSEAKSSATVGREALADAAGRTLVLLGSRGLFGATIALQDTDTVAVSVEVVDSGRVHETLPAEMSGDPVTLRLAPAYLGDALAALTGGKVRIETVGPLTPVVLRDPERDDVLHVVMPQRQD